MTTPPRTNGTGNSGKFTNAGAAAGGFFGAMGGSFVPPVTVNVNKTAPKAAPTQSAAGGRGEQFMLPDPDFRSAAELRDYCNHLRAIAVHASIEVHVAAEILQAALAQANGLPQDNVIQHKLRARKVARKLKKSADALADAAALAAATYAAFQREYADLMQARQPNRPSQSRPFQF